MQLDEILDWNFSGLTLYYTVTLAEAQENPRRSLGEALKPSSQVADLFTLCMRVL